MKRLLALGLGALLALPVLSATFVFAHEDEETSTSSQIVQNENPEQTTETQEQTTTTSTSKTLEERIAAHKAAMQTKLTNSEKTRLKSKCKAAQGLVSSVKGRINGIETSRGKVYSNVFEHLNDLSEKLENKGVDTAELDAAIDELETKVNTFSADLAIYKQAVSDLAEVDCTTDPEGFKASLEAARKNLETVRKDGQDIRSHLKDKIKPLLVTIRTQLEGQDKEEEE